MVKKICTSDLRHRVELQSMSEVKGSGGTQTKTFPTIATVWAKIETLSGNDQLNALQLERPVTNRISIRHRSDYKDVRQIIFDGRTFWVLAGINIDERSIFDQFLVEEGGQNLDKG